MSNPYAAPEAGLADRLIEDNTGPRSLRMLGGYWVLFIFTLAFAVFTLTAIPRFEDIFRSFGADLPSLTLLVFKGRLMVFFPALMVLLPALLLSRREVLQKHERRNYLVCFVALLVGFLTFCAIVVTAMYLPILAMGSAV